MQNEVVTSKKDIRSVKDGVEGLQKEVVEIKTDVKVLKENVGSLHNEITEVKTDVKILRRDVTKIRKDVDVIISFFDREYLDIEKRVERIEDYLKLPAIPTMSS